MPLNLFYSEMRRDRDILLIITLLLVCIGIIMIYSSSGIYAYENLNDSAYFFKKHLVYVCLGIIIFLLTLMFPYEKLNTYVPILLVLTYIMLILVLIPGIGIESGGARRWLKIGLFHFQPSEIAKLTVIIYLANFVSRKVRLISSFKRGFLPPLLICIGMTGLILLQADLGSALFLLIITVFILIIAGVKIRHLIAVVLSGIPFMYFFIFSIPYRRNRVIAFLNPWNYPQGIGFQLVQSYLAFGSGGFLGAGLGKSKQKLFYLPASHTDFIFSIIGEELGFLGAVTVLILFFLLLIIGFRIILSKSSIFARLLTGGIVFNISLQAIINMSVATGLIPTKGLPLPFISYGGTSLIINIIQVGLLLNISKNAT